MRVQSNPVAHGISLRSGDPPPNDDKKSIPRQVGEAFLDGFVAVNKVVDDHPTLARAIGTGVAVSRGLATFPKFVYPTVIDASPAERSQIYNALDHLPLADVNSVKTISMVDEIASNRPGWVTNGRAFDHVATNRVELSRAQLVTPEKLQATLTHEVGHTVDYESQWFGVVGQESTHEPWGEGPHVTSYAETNHKEDFAESYEAYHLDPEHLKETNPDKYHRMQELQKRTPLERLMDREAFRETGKYIGEKIHSSGARHASEGFHYMAGFLQAGRGIAQLRAGQDNPDQHFRGVLNLASGLCFASGFLAIPGMALHGANAALNRAVERGDIGAADADAAVRKASDPAERVIRTLGSTIKVTDEFRVPQEVESATRVNRAIGTALGGGVGGTAGALVGPYVGVLVGYQLAGGMGGAMGLVGGALGGYLLGTEFGGRLGGALGAKFD